MSETVALIERLDAADEPDSALDHAILLSHGMRYELDWGPEYYLPSGERFYSHEITKSIDDALAFAMLVRPGADVDLELRELMTDGKVRRVTDATIYGRAYSREADAKAYANSPALALCMAALRAREHDIQKVIPSPPSPASGG